jgi:chain length determinant protein tyrosine kinase EpsG
MNTTSFIDDIVAAARPVERPVDRTAEPARGAPVPRSVRRLGDHLGELLTLDTATLERVARHQGESGLRFGEAAVALGVAEAGDVERALGRQFEYPARVEGLSGESSELTVLCDPGSARAESVRTLRSQLTMRLEAAAAPRRIVAAISAERGDGRTWCVANLGTAMAQLGGRTLLVDADLRHPRLHRLFGLKPGPGLCGVLGERAGAEAILAVPGVPGLFVLPAGAEPPNPLELVERRSFGEVLRRLGDNFHHVLVDTPAAELGADASVVAARCGAAMLVARRDASSARGIQRLVASLKAPGPLLVGAVLNDAGIASAPARRQG